MCMWQSHSSGGAVPTFTWLCQCVCTPTCSTWGAVWLRGKVDLVRHMDLHPVAQLATNTKRLAQVRTFREVRSMGEWPCVAACVLPLRGADVHTLFSCNTDTVLALCTLDRSCSRVGQVARLAVPYHDLVQSRERGHSLC